MAKGVAILKSSDEGVKGSIYFTQEGDATTVNGNICGLKPGPHAFHVHAHGDTTNGCISTRPHGAHVGDLGNIIVGDDGIASITIVDKQISLTAPNSIIGRVLVVHAVPGDLEKGGHQHSKSTQNAGGRIACGIIELQS